MASDRKADRIYAAVSEALMDLRVQLSMRQRDRLGEPTYHQLDGMVARAMDRAAANAVEAYRTPLRPSRAPAAGAETGGEE